MSRALYGMCPACGGVFARTRAGGLRDHRNLDHAPDAPWSCPRRRVEKSFWKTRWGTLLLQSESTRGERRQHYAQWHDDARGRGAPSLDAIDASGSDRFLVQRKIQRWVNENGGEGPFDTFDYSAYDE